MNSEEFIKAGCNILDDREFREVFLKVFGKVAETLAKTYGPYGQTTIIEKMGNYHITKDGWNILKNIRFADGTESNVMRMIVDATSTVVNKVGDGSTSVVMASNEILKTLEASKVLENVRAKDFLDMWGNTVMQVIERVQANATPINKDEDSDLSDIYKLAHVSTNGSDEFATIIQNIYKETGNPSIDYKASRTNETYFEVVNGYQLPFMTYLDGVFVNNDSGTCDVANPYIFMIDFKLEFDDITKKLLMFAQQIAREDNRKLIVVAPYYDTITLGTKIKRMVEEELRMGKDPSTIFTRVSLINELHKTLYKDFSILTGGSIITMSDLVEVEADDDAKLLEITEKAVGKVDRIVVAKEHTTISGLSNKDEKMYEICYNDAVYKFTESMEKDMQKSIISGLSFDFKKRLSKLKCKVGTIYVGGSTELAKEANKDLVEDAVKACESAYRYGYNTGCSLSIIRTAKAMIEETEDEKVKAMLAIIIESFTNVFALIIKNKYKNTDMSELVEKIINEDYRTSYDLTKEETTDSIINSCYTDIQVLMSASSIVGMVVSSNQYLSIVVH